MSTSTPGKTALPEFAATVCTACQTKWKTVPIGSLPAGARGALRPRRGSVRNGLSGGAWISAASGGTCPTCGLTAREGRSGLALERPGRRAIRSLRARPGRDDGRARRGRVELVAVPGGAADVAGGVNRTHRECIAAIRAPGQVVSVRAGAGGPG